MSKRRKAALIAITLAGPVSGAAAKPAHTPPMTARDVDSPSEAKLERAAEKAGLRTTVLRAALAAFRKASESGVVKRALLTVIDYSLPSRVPRLWVLDLDHATVLAHELVAHGRASGDDIASKFSNAMGSLKSSLGAFVTADTYQGKNGLSLRLEGLDPGLNDRAMARGIVVHGAPYVSQDAIRTLGRLGRSEGCPALSTTAAPRIIDLIRGGTVVFASDS
jgi:hypothetical protein